HQLAALPARDDRRARPGQSDERADRRGPPPGGGGRAARHARARHLRAGGGGLLSTARRTASGQSADPLAALARGPLRSHYLLYGEETYLVERALGLLRTRLTPGGGVASGRTVWGDEDAERVVAALEDLASPPLFGGAQSLVIRRAEALREPEQEAILARLPALGAGGSLILVAPTADQRRRLFAACVRAGAAFGFRRVDLRGAPGPGVRLPRRAPQARAARRGARRAGPPRRGDRRAARHLELARPADRRPGPGARPRARPRRAPAAGPRAQELATPRGGVRGRTARD